MAIRQETLSFAERESIDRATPNKQVLLDSLIRAFQSGSRPEEIQKLYPAVRLSQIYAVIAIHLDRQEVEQSSSSSGEKDGAPEA